MTDSYFNVESFKFADVVQLWGRERLTHEVIVARELAKGIIKDGLRFQSVDPKWVDSTESFRGYPLVGYAAKHELPPILLRADALEHLLRIVNKNVEPDLKILDHEFVKKQDFVQWLVHTGQAMPKFWFNENDSKAYT